MLMDCNILKEVIFLKTKPTALALAFATMIEVFVPLSAGAMTITTSDVAFNGSASVTDSEGGTSTSINGASLGTSSITQYNATTGVLMEATLNLTSTQTQTVQVTSTSLGGSGANPAVTSYGQGSSTAKISAPGVANTFSAIGPIQDSCSNPYKSACQHAATTTSFSTNLTALASSLDNYVGTSTVLVSRSADLTAEQTSNVFNGTESTKTELKSEGNLSATYNYLLHAAPSFDNDSTLLTLDLDFGTVFLGDSSSLNFSIFNLADPNRVGLDLDSFSETSDPGSLFSTNLANFLGLAQGESNPFKAFFNASTLGLWGASYSLNLSDANVGAATSRNDYTLLLNLTGNVIQRASAAPAPIPEPGVLALFGIGLLGLGLGRRKAC